MKQVNPIVEKTNVQYISPNDTVKTLLEASAIEHSDHIVLKHATEDLTYADLNRRVNRLAHGLLSNGVRQKDHVAVMLDHHIDHIITFFALAKLGAILVPVNVHLSGAPLNYLLAHSEPRFIIAEAHYENRLIAACSETEEPQTKDGIKRFVIVRHSCDSDHGINNNRLSTVSTENVSVISYEHCAQCPNDESPPTNPQPEDTLAICYTSGTTGAPKGAFITDKMYRASAVSSLILSGIEDRDVLLFWEPIYHLFGIEVLVLTTMKQVTLGMVDRFSASQFWRQTREFGATHIHYVGGVPQLLMKQPPKDDDKNNPVRVAWGGGCPIALWRSFESRFGLEMRDSFGMTETSSLNIVNIEGEPGALGKPLPYYSARIVDDSGVDVESGQTGQLLIRSLESGLITPGYFKNPEATATAYKDGWFQTGDLVRQDERGIYFFVGRQKDSIRRRGENISAWEVERVISTHTDVEEAAVIAVPNEFGDEEIKAFIKPRSSAFSPEHFLLWCQGKMAKYQIPRFIEIVKGFPKTPTQRIMKHKLSRSTTDCWDRGE